MGDLPLPHSGITIRYRFLPSDGGWKVSTIPFLPITVDYLRARTNYHFHRAITCSDTSIPLPDLLPFYHYTDTICSYHSTCLFVLELLHSTGTTSGSLRSGVPPPTCSFVLPILLNLRCSTYRSVLRWVEGDHHLLRYLPLPPAAPATTTCSGYHLGSGDSAAVLLFWVGGVPFCFCRFWRRWVQIYRYSTCYRSTNSTLLRSGSGCTCLDFRSELPFVTACLHCLPLPFGSWSCLQYHFLPFVSTCHRLLLVCWVHLRACLRSGLPGSGSTVTWVTCRFSCLLRSRGMFLGGLDHFWVGGSGVGVLFSAIGAIPPLDTSMPFYLPVRYLPPPGTTTCGCRLPLIPFYCGVLPAGAGACRSAVPVTLPRLLPACTVYRSRSTVGLPAITTPGSCGRVALRGRAACLPAPACMPLHLPAVHRYHAPTVLHFCRCQITSISTILHSIPF